MTHATTGSRRAPVFTSREEKSRRFLGWLHSFHCKSGHAASLRGLNASFSTKKAFLLHIEMLKEKPTWTERDNHACNVDPRKFHGQVSVKTMLQIYSKLLHRINPEEIQT